MYYSLINDNFNDFFTEYVPFGEDAVLYFEEREYRRRYPRSSNHYMSSQREVGNRVTIPSGSGISSRLVEAKGKEEVKSHERPTEKAVGEVIALKSSTTVDSQYPKEGSGTGLAMEIQRDTQKAPTSVPTALVAKQPPVSESREVIDEPMQKQETVEISVVPSPLTMIVPLAISDAEEPVVQDLVKVVNNIITVINADHASSKYSTTIDLAKAELSQIGRRINTMKEEAVEEKVRAVNEEFDKAAKELVRRLEDEIRDQETRWLLCH